MNPIKINNFTFARVLAGAAVCFPLVYASPVGAETAAAAPDATEISVTGDAPFIQPPDFARVSLRIDQTSGNAEEALTAAADRESKVTQAVHAISPSAVITLRGDRIANSSSSPSSVSNAAAGIRSGVPVTVQRTLAIGVSDLAKLGKVIDTAIISGSGQVIDVSYSVQTSTKANNDAVALATQRAHEKAQLTAKAMGVTLGPALSAIATEEPEGESIRNQLHEGQNVIDYGDKILHVFVNVRYAIGK